MILQYLHKYFPTLDPLSIYRQKDHRAHFFHALLPDVVHVRPYTLVINEKTKFRSLYASTFPLRTHMFWLDKLLASFPYMILSVHIEPLAKERMIRVLQRKIIAQKERLITLEQKGRIIRKGTLMGLEHLEDIQVALEKGEENLFHISCSIGIQGENDEQLQKDQQNMQSLAQSEGLLLRTNAFRQLQGFSHILPILSPLIDTKHVFDSTSLSYAHFFSSGSILEKGGILYGKNISTKGIVIADRFQRENYNSITLAKSGMGKSYAAKLEMIRMFLKGVKIIVIDQEGEYVHVCQKLGGEIIKLGNQEKSIDPFYIDKEVVKEKGIEDKIQFLKQFFKRVCSYYDEQILDKALMKIYTNKRTTPSMYALYNILRKMEEKGILMSDAIYSFAKGSSGKLYAPSYINMDKQCTVFDLSSLDEENKRRMMMVIGEYMWSSITESERKARLLIIDEAHKLLDIPELATYFKGLTKRARKYGLGIHYISQDVGDFMKNEDGKSIIANCATKFLFGQDQTAISSLASLLALSEYEKGLLPLLSKGECLLLAGSHHAHVKIESLPIEQTYIQ